MYYPVGKVKTKFCYRLDNYKSKHRAFKKGNQNLFQKRFPDGHSGIDDLDFVIFEQYETHEQFKKGETFL